MSSYDAHKSYHYPGYRPHSEAATGGKKGYPEPTGYEGIPIGKRKASSSVAASDGSAEPEGIEESNAGVAGPERAADPNAKREAEWGDLLRPNVKVTAPTSVAAKEGDGTNPKATKDDGSYLTPGGYIRAKVYPKGQRPKGAEMIPATLRFTEKKREGEDS
ncbi:Nn.00g003740.m01.CDS01 [Neocucurbitaria sp. VM-36]